MRKKNKSHNWLNEFNDWFDKKTICSNCKKEICNGDVIVWLKNGGCLCPECFDKKNYGEEAENGNRNGNS